MSALKELVYLDQDPPCQWFRHLRIENLTVCSKGTRLSTRKEKRRFVYDINFKILWL